MNGGRVDEGALADRAEPDIRQWLDLAALGAVCDVTVLTGFNRALTGLGLGVMSAWRNPGLNALLAERRQLAICVYDLASLDGTLMMDLLRTHPLTMIGGVLRENPFFTPPAEMLRELSARKN